MGNHTEVASGGEIVEGDPLRSDGLAAVVAWNDTERLPLLRIHPSAIRAGRRDAIYLWAREALSRGRRLAILPAEDSQEG